MEKTFQTFVKKWGEGGVGIYISAELQLLHDIRVGDKVEIKLLRLERKKKAKLKLDNEEKETEENDNTN